MEQRVIEEIITSRLTLRNKNQYTMAGQEKFIEEIWVEVDKERKNQIEDFRSQISDYVRELVHPKADSEKSRDAIIENIIAREEIIYDIECAEYVVDIPDNMQKADHGSTKIELKDKWNNTIKFIEVYGYSVQPRVLTTDGGAWQ